MKITDVNDNPQEEMYHGGAYPSNDDDAEECRNATSDGVEDDPVEGWMSAHVKETSGDYTHMARPVLLLLP